MFDPLIQHAGWHRWYVWEQRGENETKRRPMTERCNKKTRGDCRPDEKKRGKGDAVKKVKEARTGRLGEATKSIRGWGGRQSDEWGKGGNKTGARGSTKIEAKHLLWKIGSAC